jgi:propanol-preferring alcohol dehydrogenase
MYTSTNAPDHLPVYACDFKPAARKLALELGATEAFDLIELTNKTAAGFTVDTTIDFISNNQSTQTSNLPAVDLFVVVLTSVTALAFTLANAALKGNAVKFPSSPTLVLVGISAENLVFSTADIVSSGIQSTFDFLFKCFRIHDHLSYAVHGSEYGPRSALVHALDLFAKASDRMPSRISLS